MSKRWGRVVAEGGAPFRFAPEAGTGFFEPHGWREREYRSAMQEARRLHRSMPNAWFYQLMGIFMSPKTRAIMRRFSGYVLLERTGASGTGGTTATTGTAGTAAGGRARS